MRKSLYFVVKRGSKRNNARQNFHQFFNFENFPLILRLSLLVDARCKKNSEDFRLYHPRFGILSEKWGKRIFYVRDLILIVRFERYTWQRRIRDSKGGTEGEDRFGSRSIKPLGQVTDCVTSLEIRSADYIEVKWNPFLAGRQRTLSILRKLETRVQGLERSILTRLHRIIRDR